MNSRSRMWLPILGCLALSACGPGDPEDARFSGTWKHTNLNGIANTSTEEMVAAIVDHKKFHITTTTEGLEETYVYDGETLFEKMTSRRVPSADASTESVLTQSEPPSPPITSEKKVQEYETGSHRFWTRAIPRDSQPGGLVAGRETVLYQGASRRPEGEYDQQDWVDVKTGVLLKGITTVYSTQVRSIVTQETWECQKIDYAPPNPSAFEKP
jgi:hypothetical protein